jgi:hypothetical protein
VGDFFDLVFIKGVEIVELEFAMANCAVIQSVFQLLTALYFLLWNHVKAKDFHKSPPG